jgi:hypothetical protein
MQTFLNDTDNSSTEPIVDYNVYLSRMDKSLQEKLFFLDKLDPCIDTIVDFGCANGALLEAVRQYKPGMRLIGIDNDEKMREACAGRAFQIYSSFADFVYQTDELRLHPVCCDKTALILSSVLHEVYSYMPYKETEELLHGLFTYGFRQIVIRDMAVNQELYAMPFNRNSKRYYYPMMRTLCHDSEMMSRWNQFAKTVSHDYLSMADAVHFLLKYRYVENWERECKENYLMYSYEHLQQKFKEYACGIDYFPVYQEHKVLEYTRDCIQKDFGFQLVDATNYKLILSHVEDSDRIV